MEFIRKRKKGARSKTRKHWFSTEGYRITWRREVFGVTVPARYQVCVRTLVPHVDGTLYEMWDFVDKKHRLIKTYNAAIKLCEQHKRLWTKACEVTGIRALTELFGKIPICFPVWVRNKLDRRIYAILIDTHKRHECTKRTMAVGDANQLDPTSTSNHSASFTEDTTKKIPTLALIVGDANVSMTRPTRCAPSKVTNLDDELVAQPVEAPAKEQEKRAAKRTRKSSKSTRKTKRNTTNTSKRTMKRSKNSQKKRSTL